MAGPSDSDTRVFSDREESMDAIRTFSMIQTMHGTSERSERQDVGERKRNMWFVNLAWKAKAAKKDFLGTQFQESQSEFPCTPADIF